jgi:hypothetical protein
MTTPVRRQLARELAATWTPALEARTKRRIDARIAAGRRRRRQLTRVALAFAIIAGGGLAYAWVGGQLGRRPGRERPAPSMTTSPLASSAQPPSATPAPSASAAADRSSATSVAVAPKASPAPHATRRRAPLAAAGSASLPPPAGEAADPIEVRFARADRARAAGHPSGAIAPLTEIVERYATDPRAAVAAFQLGRVYADELGDAARAAVAFEQARALAPAGPLAGDARRRAEDARRNTASPGRRPTGDTP